MIELTMNKFSDGTSCPVCLKIEDKEYVYPDDRLFENLNGFENYQIKLITISSAGKKESKKIIKRVFNNEYGIPTIELD